MKKKLLVASLLLLLPNLSLTKDDSYGQNPFGAFDLEKAKELFQTYLGGGTQGSKTEPMLGSRGSLLKRIAATHALDQAIDSFATQLRKYESSMRAAEVDSAYASLADAYNVLRTAESEERLNTAIGALRRAAQKISGSQSVGQSWWQNLWTQNQAGKKEQDTSTEKGSATQQPGLTDVASGLYDLWRQYQGAPQK